jgi:hypothetical protein
MPTIFGLSLEVYFILIIIGMPTFFIWGWFFKKFIKTDKTKTLATWTATIAATPVIYVGIIMLWVFSISYHPTNDFDKEKWFADKEKRYELSENLIKSKMLIGKTKSEVRQILGNEGNTDESNHWNYYFGFRPGFANIDSDVLDIEFKNEKVIRVGQHET